MILKKNSISLAISVSFFIGNPICLGVTTPDFQFRQSQEKEHQQFLDKDFQPGKIILQEGYIYLDKLNYNLLLNCICYYNEQDEPRLLDNLSNVLIITYGDRSFIPITKGKVAEIIKSFPDGSRLLVERESKIESDEKGVFGTSTITASTTKASSGIFSGQTVIFDVPENTSFTISEKFLIEKEGKKNVISSLRSLRKVYPSNWNLINGFAKEHNTNIQNIKDLLELLNYSTQLR